MLSLDLLVDKLLLFAHKRLINALLLHHHFYLHRNISQDRASTRALRWLRRDSPVTSPSISNREHGGHLPFRDEASGL